MTDTRLLSLQYTITGFDASAHMVSKNSLLSISDRPWLIACFFLRSHDLTQSEETMNAEVSAPRGVIMSVGVSAIFG